MAAPFHTSLQSSIRVASACTIRFTDDPGGSPSHSDFAITAGTVYNSVDDLLTAWTAQLQADLTSSHVVQREEDTGASDRVMVTTAGANWSVVWSHAGDGDQVRDYLGASGDISNQPRYAPIGTTPAAYRSTYAARIIQRGSSSRDRAQLTTISGAHRWQSSNSPGTVDRVDLEIVLWIGGSTTDHASHEDLETWVDEVFKQSEPWSLYHNDYRWQCRFSDSPLEIVPERAGGKSDQLWEVRLAAVAEVTPW
jgi:hypothetical protein